MAIRLLRYFFLFLLNQFWYTIFSQYFSISSKFSCLLASSCSYFPFIIFLVFVTSVLLYLFVHNVASVFILSVFLISIARVGLYFQLTAFQFVVFYYIYSCHYLYYFLFSTFFAFFLCFLLLSYVGCVGHLFLGFFFSCISMSTNNFLFNYHFSCIPQVFLKTYLFKFF